jgi:ABC-type antimicrobial peptide transport system permease subunit
LAVLLAAVEIYGLIAYSLNFRGDRIRLALGAKPNRIRNMVVFEALRLSLASVIGGLLAAFGLATLPNRIRKLGLNPLRG